MSNIAINVEKLSKRFRIGVKEQTHDTLFGSIASWVKSPLSNYKSLRKLSHFSENGNTADILWALKDVSFEVKTGEVIGIIGRNGAGKSTLLKILSRITEPTSGRVEINGRVSSLLEVGTGFHPELTGRENIYLNGTILGMTKNEIDHKFDEIVAFSEVEKFIDTPVKRYSSGMKVRLAFSVAAHLEPEILIIDEVLAVGDASFQKKCLGKMKSVGEQGRTVIFVSHDMAAVRRLCHKTILLDFGEKIMEGDTENIILYYLNDGNQLSAHKIWKDIQKAPGNEIVRLNEVNVHDKNLRVMENFEITQPIGITMRYNVLEEGHEMTHVFNLFNEEGIHVMNNHDVTSDLSNASRDKGEYEATMWIPGNFLAEGMFSISIAIVRQDPVAVHFHEHDAVTFKIYDDIKGNSARGKYTGKFPGVIRPLLHWESRKIEIAQII